MSNKIPHGIKENVIQLWLQGLSRNHISKTVGIGKGTVTGIIQNTRLTMNDTDLLRAVAETLHEKGVDIHTFASAINLKRKIDESEWPQEGIEWLLEELKIISFKSGIDFKVLLDDLISILILSINLNISIEKSNYFLEVLENHMVDLETSVSGKKAELCQVMQDIRTEIEDFEDYKRYKNWKDERLSLINSKREDEMKISELSTIITELSKNANINQYSFLPTEKNIPTI